MQKTIREQAELLGFEITDWDIKQIKERYFHVLVARSDNINMAIPQGSETDPWLAIKSIRSVIKKYFAAND